MEILLDSLKVKFYIIAISETKLQKGVKPMHNIELSNYEMESTPTKACKEGTLLYISKNLNYKPKDDLQIYEPTKLESTFFEIINTIGKIFIVGCIYKNHTISPREFTDKMSPLLRKLSREKSLAIVQVTSI